MITVLTIASVVLALAALADGASTVRFLKNPTLVEIDNLMVWIFGTNRPSAATVYSRGGAVIAAEIALAFGLTHLFHPLGYALSVGILVQSVLHIQAAILNLKLPS
jgi:hypothetical protein